MKLQLIVCSVLSVFGLVVAPNCAEDNPWNSKDVSCFYERFHPFEFSENVRDQVQNFLGEFRYVATATEKNCLGDCIHQNVERLS